MDEAQIDQALLEAEATLRNAMSGAMPAQAPQTPQAAGQLERAIAVAVDRGLAARLANIPVIPGPPGEHGRDGPSRGEVAELVHAAVAKLPKPKDGKDGKDGQDGKKETVRTLIRVPENRASEVSFTPSGSGATATTVAAKLQETLTLDTDYSADRTGVTSAVTALQSAMTELSSRGGGTLLVRQGTYLLTMASDSDAVSIPSDVEVIHEPGVQYRYSYNDGPAFVISEKDNVRFIGRPKFVFTGTYNTGAGSGTTRFGYARSGGNYEWRCHVACVGSDNVEIDIECEGNTTSNVQDRAIMLLGNDDGSLTVGNKIRLAANDVCIGLAMEGQKFFDIEVTQDRYSNASSALFGPGHVVYHTYTSGNTDSSGGTIKIVDLAGTAISSYTTGANSAAMRGLSNCDVEIDSLREEGAVYFDKNNNVRYKIKYRSSSTQADTNTGTIQALSTSGVSSDVHMDVDIQHLGIRDQGPISLSAITNASDNVRCRVVGKVIRNGNGAGVSASLSWGGEYGFSDIVYYNIGSSTQRTLVSNGKGDNNVHRIRSMGAVSNPRVGVAAGSNNTFVCSGDAAVDFDTQEFTPSSGNAVIWDNAREYQSNKSIGVTTNPTTTFQLPKDGAYLVSITLIESALDHARSSMFWVLWDNDTNDFTTTEEIVTAATKGASAPSAMALAVDNAGLCTMTSTADSATWSLRYGYRQLSGM